ncbi:MAG: hypothetical protein IKB71_06525 [Lentisphaeria bacterium]|nr:hypothetical protein [Lentisphaeria bacterium]
MKAYWIAPEGVKERINCHFHAVKEFEVDKIPADFEIKAACESYYLLKVNNVYVCRGPARGSSVNYFYDTIDIAGYLHKGKNEILFEVHCMNIPTGRNIPIEPALWVDGGESFASDASWKMYLSDNEWHKNPPYYDMQQGFAEWRDLRYEDDLKETATVILPENSEIYRRKILKLEIPAPQENTYLPAEVLYPAFVPQADLTDTRIAVIGDKEEHFAVPDDMLGKLNALTLGGRQNIVVPVAPDGGGFTVIVNFNRLISGRAELDITAPAGTVIDMGHEEELFNKERLRADHTATNPSYNLSDRNIAKDGFQTVGNYMFDRGFRMVRVTFRNYDKPIILHGMRGIDRRYPFALKSRFFCSDYKLNRIYEIAMETISACTTDIFTDCPWRERLFFVNDFVVENRSALQLFGDYTLNKHAFDMIYMESDENGIFPCVIPSHREMMKFHGFPSKFGWILSANLTLPLSVLEYYLYSGDAESIKKYYPWMKRMLATFRQWKKADGVLDVYGDYNDTDTFFDWSFELNGKLIPASGSSLMNYLYIIALQSIQKLREAAGCPEDDFAPEIEEMQRATVNVFYDKNAKMMLDAVDEIAVDEDKMKLLGVVRKEDISVKTSRITQALALLAGADEYIKDENILQKAIVDPSLFSPELFYGSFVLLAMKKAGLYQDTLNYIYKYWTQVADSGSPTLWENGVYSAGKEGFGGSASLCHGFSTSPVDFMQTAILGITPTAGGFSEFKFDPVHCNLEFAHGQVPTPHGTIRVNWKRSGSKISAEIFVPMQCTAVTPAGILHGGRHEISFEVNK